MTQHNIIADRMKRDADTFEALAVSMRSTAVKLDECSKNESALIARDYLGTVGCVVIGVDDARTLYLCANAAGSPPEGADFLVYEEMLERIRGAFSAIGVPL